MVRTTPTIGATRLCPGIFGKVARDRGEGFANDRGVLDDGRTVLDGPAFVAFEIGQWDTQLTNSLAKQIIEMLHAGHERPQTHGRLVQRIAVFGAQDQSVGITPEDRLGIAGLAEHYDDAEFLVGMKSIDVSRIFQELTDNGFIVDCRHFFS